MLLAKSFLVGVLLSSANNVHGSSPPVHSAAAPSSVQRRCHSSPRRRSLALRGGASHAHGPSPHVGRPQPPHRDGATQASEHCLGAVRGSSDSNGAVDRSADMVINAPMLIQLFRLLIQSIQAQCFKVAKIIFTGCFEDGADLIQRQSMITFKFLLAGAIAGIVSRTVVSPLEVVATVNMASAGAVGNPIQELEKLWRREGLAGFFKVRLESRSQISGVGRGRERELIDERCNSVCVACAAQ